ncbi:hypothetical protein [Actinoplanes sp. G11-F43]|uniref:hypothetical protein n=1 Tax=Actinoplanes sp. G11-F43 TaxID=3424130 RepID=UPI003D3475ED
MKKLNRVIATGGIGLLAALAIGAGPAQAVATNVSHSKPSPRPVYLNEGVQVAGFYSSLQACEKAGRFGERNAFWDDYNCSPVRVGPRGGAWALQVVSYDNWDRIGFEVALRSVCAFPSQYRPVWVGQYGPGRPAKVFQRHPGRAIYGHPGRVVFGKPGRVDFGKPGRGDFGKPGRGDFGKPGKSGPDRGHQGGGHRSGMGDGPRGGGPGR